MYVLNIGPIVYNSEAECQLFGLLVLVLIKWHRRLALLYSCFQVTAVILHDQQAKISRAHSMIFRTFIIHLFFRGLWHPPSLGLGHVTCQHLLSCVFIEGLKLLRKIPNNNIFSSFLPSIKKIVRRIIRNPASAWGETLLQIPRIRTMKPVLCL